MLLASTGQCRLANALNCMYACDDDDRMLKTSTNTHQSIREKKTKTMKWRCARGWEIEDREQLKWTTDKYTSFGIWNNAKRSKLLNFVSGSLLFLFIFFYYRTFKQPMGYNKCTYYAIVVWQTLHSMFPHSFCSLTHCHSFLSSFSLFLSLLCAFLLACSQSIQCVLVVVVVVVNSYSCKMFFSLLLEQHSLVSWNKEELSGYWICNANYIRFTCKLFWKQFGIVSGSTENGCCNCCCWNGK